MFGETSPSNSPNERRAILALSLVAEVGSVAHRQLSERFRSAERALDAEFSPEVVRDAYAQADELLARGVKAGLEFITQIDEQYPEPLRQLYTQPPVLWSLGSWDTLKPPIVAIVGTRRATSYGLRMTREIAGALARAGACIVSGMAMGVDAAAHQAALETSGRTVAVLGTGANVAYPRAHRALHRDIVSRGLVLSEFPPGAHAWPACFPRRNRIIAALARLTIVIEAPHKSGALGTSTHAMELGRDVAAIPGPIDSPQCQGSNELLRDGAHSITSVEDALRLVELGPPPKQKAPVLHGEHELRIWNALLERGAASLDELCARTQLPVSECLSTLTALEMRGVVECALTGAIRRR